MENVAHNLRNNQGDQENRFNDTRLTVLRTESNEPVTGLCMNCSHFSGCTFPMRGKAIFCEEYD
jgi:hypothetical protein